MIIDTATRVWTGPDPWPDRSEPQEGPVRQTAYSFPPHSPEAHLLAMHCVDGAFVLGYRSCRGGIDHPLEMIMAFVHEDPDRRFAVAGIDPLSDAPISDVERAMHAGAVGVTIAPADCACRPTHDRCMEVLRFCARRRLPVFVSNPGIARPLSVLEFANPALFDEPLREIPSLRIVFCDMGCAFLAETLLMLAKHPGAFASTAALASRPGALRTALRDAHERGVADKVLFGSGFPRCTPQVAIERMYRAAAFRPGPADDGAGSIPREVVRRIIERNVMDVLGLDVPPPPPRAARGDSGDEHDVLAPGEEAWNARELRP